MEVFLLTRLRRGRTSQRFSSEENRSRFVGRDRELALLQSGLERASEGDGCAIGLVADAGVGKSRLCFEFAERCRAADIRVLEGRALAHSRATPFEPVIDMMKSYFDIKFDDPAALARQKVAEVLHQLGPEMTAELPLLIDFLGLADAAMVPEKLDPAVRRGRLNALFRRLVRLATQDSPAVLLVEDLHYLDSGSESFLEVPADTLT